eukprot:365205-Chlamydomonas_euryale.AAC.13
MRFRGPATLSASAHPAPGGRSPWRKVPLAGGPPGGRSPWRKVPLAGPPGGRSPWRVSLARRSPSRSCSSALVHMPARPHTPSACPTSSVRCLPPHYLRPPDFVCPLSPAMHFPHTPCACWTSSGLRPHPGCAQAAAAASVPGMAALPVTAPRAASGAYRCLPAPAAPTTATGRRIASRPPWPSVREGPPPEASQPAWPFVRGGPLPEGEQAFKGGGAGRWAAGATGGGRGMRTSDRQQASRVARSSCVRERQAR